MQEKSRQQDPEASAHITPTFKKQHRMLPSAQPAFSILCVLDCSASGMVPITVKTGLSIPINTTKYSSQQTVQRLFFQGSLESTKFTINTNNPWVSMDSFSIVKEGAEAIPIQKTGKQAEVEATWLKSPRQESSGNEIVSNHGSSGACGYNYNPIVLTCMGYFSQPNFLFPESYGSLCSIYDTPLQLLMLSFVSLARSHLPALCCSVPLAKDWS